MAENALKYIPENNQNFVKHNQKAWNYQVQKRNKWTIPVDSKTIRNARNGEWQIVLTPTLPIPKSWFPKLDNCRILCLASGGGQQGPILSAAGAKIVVMDLAEKQLAQDQAVATKNNLDVDVVQGNMLDSFCFKDEIFDVVINPVSTCFVSDVGPVYQHVHNVLKRGGVFMTAFANPALYIFDELEARKKRLSVRYKIPYSDYDLDEETRLIFENEHEPIAFGHSIQDLIGKQIEHGFVLDGFYEDTFPDHPLSNFMNLFIATRSVKV